MNARKENIVRNRLRASRQRLTARVAAILWNALLMLCLGAQAWAAPDYVTAWPKQVPVEKPDPVLGDNPFWEFWVYSEAFSRRFRGFPVEKANTEFSPGMQAMVFRIYMDYLWAKLWPEYPKQYKCEWDVYFDSSLTIPLSQNPRRVAHRHPDSVEPSFARLEPSNEKDSEALRTSRPVETLPKAPPLIFAANPLDGRFSIFGVMDYRLNLVPGLAFAALAASTYCQAMAPKTDSGVHWLSLFGNRPYKDDVDVTLLKGWHGGYRPGIKSVFDPGPNPAQEGYFRVPEAFYQAVLPKVTLVKVLNRCIVEKYLHALPDDKTSPKRWEEIVRVCKEVEEQGLIYDFFEQRYGLHKLGF